MFRKYSLLIPLLTVSASAQTITLTATHLTMEHGQPVPPLIWRASPSLAGLGCTGTPSTSTTATSSSVPGNYTITIAAGTFRCPGYSMSFVSGKMTVIAADGRGAQLTPNVTYPPGFFSGPTNPVLNVTNNATCKLDNTGTTDGTGNTTCINTLLALHIRSSNCGIAPLYYNYLYFPTGTYNFNGQIRPCGNRWMLLGDGPQRSIIRLVPNSPLFNGTANTEFFFPYGASVNNNFMDYLYNIGFDIGYGNPKAIGLALETNNLGGARNVVIWSEDSNCLEAVGFVHSYPGPALFKNVAMYGCGSAILSNQVEYSYTFDQITTEGQTSTAVVTGPMKFAIQHWLSDNTVPALTVALNGGVSILDSSLLNGATGNTAITAAAGSSIFTRSVTVTGYGISLSDAGMGTTVTYHGNLAQTWTGPVHQLFPGTPGSPHLPDQETPIPTDDPNPATWTQLSSTVANWPSQISGSSSVTVYAAPGTYTAPQGSAKMVTITVGNNVNHIVMWNAQGGGPYYTFNSTGTSNTPLVVDGCIYSRCYINQQSHRTVVLQDMSPRQYTASVGAGNFFAENVASPAISFVPGQSIWGRQFDVESMVATGITCAHCKLWILGHKTENHPTATLVLDLSSGAQAEIFTGFYYPLKIPSSPTSGMLTLTDSSIWAPVIFDFVNKNGENWSSFVSETQNGVTRTIDTSGGSGNFFLTYYSQGAGGIDRTRKTRLR